MAPLLSGKVVAGVNVMVAMFPSMSPKYSDDVTMRGSSMIPPSISKAFKGMKKVVDSASKSTPSLRSESQD